MHRTVAFAVIFLLVISGLASACTPAAPPMPSAVASGDVPASPTSTPESTQPTATPTLNPDLPPDWQNQWDQMSAAADQEGKVAIAGIPGDAAREAAMAFEKTFPHIQVDYTGVTDQELVSKMLSERQSGQYLWDVYEGSAITALSSLKPKGAIATLRPDLLLPEIVDSSKWIGGFEDLWMDTGHQQVLDFQGTRDYFVYVNRDVVPESELSTIDQLLDPKWKGKIASGDPRVMGKSAMDDGELLMRKGENFVRRLLSQDLVIFGDDRSEVEALVRGQYPIALGVDMATLHAVVQQGARTNIQPLEGKTLNGTELSPGQGNVALINPAPHPNAAKVFINWLLSKQGQTVYVQKTGNNSRRLDVDGPSATKLDPKIQYPNVQKEANVALISKAMEIAKELIK